MIKLKTNNLLVIISSAPKNIHKCQITGWDEMYGFESPKNHCQHML